MSLITMTLYNLQACMLHGIIFCLHELMFMPDIQEEQRVIEAKIRMRKEEMQREAEREKELAEEREKRLREGPPPEPPRPRSEPSHPPRHGKNLDSIKRLCAISLQQFFDSLGGGDLFCQSGFFHCDAMITVPF
jgi:hypothetical protein